MLKLTLLDEDLRLFWHFLEYLWWDVSSSLAITIYLHIQFLHWRSTSYISLLQVCFEVWTAMSVLSWNEIKEKRIMKKKINILFRQIPIEVENIFGIYLFIELDNNKNKLKPGIPWYKANEALVIEGNITVTEFVTIWFSWLWKLNLHLIENQIYIWF